MKYQVYNRQTQKVVGTYVNRKTALKKRDKADNEYGSYVHTIREVLTQEV
jgi:hypothetical protein